MNPTTTASNWSRYFQFALLVLAGGAIYPLIYLKQSYEINILQVFQITQPELNTLYAYLGVIYFICYIPSGWLADRFQAKYLVPFSLLGLSALGLWFSTIPPKEHLTIIFIGWGLCAGLTFWASLIKGVKLLAKPEEQGRFFGILDGGRGLVEAVLASAALVIFNYFLTREGETSSIPLTRVIYLYVVVTASVALLSFAFISKSQTTEPSNSLLETLRGMRQVLAIPEVWLLSLVIFCGYHLFYSTYYFSAFLERKHEFSGTAAAAFILMKLWMRPIGGIGGGFLGDYFGNAKVLSITLVTASIALVTFAFISKDIHSYVLLALVSLLGITTYAIRGLYWSLLDLTHTPTHLMGFAIGVISMLAYSTDIFAPKVHSLLSGIAQNTTQADEYFFTYNAIVGIIGFFATLLLLTRVKKIQSVK